MTPKSGDAHNTSEPRLQEFMEHGWPAMVVRATSTETCLFNLAMHPGQSGRLAGAVRTGNGFTVIEFDRSLGASIFEVIEGTAAHCPVATTQSSSKYLFFVRASRQRSSLRLYSHRYSVVHEDGCNVVLPELALGSIWLTSPTELEWSVPAEDLLQLAIQEIVRLQAR
jgi:hypothetical protein